MPNVEQLLTQEEEQQIIDAIIIAEKLTSGEIRVHLENHTEKDTLERASEVFSYLKMDETKEHNGVLFYLGVQDKQFAIIGDTGINKKVTTDFWNSTKDIVLTEFKKGNFANGLIKGIKEAGEQLQHYFPINGKDTNELDNSISKGKF